jgi:hypothetical protein
MSALRSASPEDVEEYVREHLIPEGMHIYKEEDFDVSATTGLTETP